MQVAIYSRKSVYTGKGESIENQIELCKQYIFAKIEGITEEDITIFEDEGFSAKNMDRPEFQRLWTELQEGRYGYLVCYRLDRISRNVSDFATLIEDLNQLGISFVCVREEFDTTKPMGKAMMYIASVFAQLERETLAERVRDNMFYLARTGRWLGGTPPTGFRSEKVEKIELDGKRKTVCKLGFDPTEIEIAKLIFEKFLELGSLCGVSKYLISQNIKSRNGNWYSLLGLKQILRNPVYSKADIDARNYFIEQNADVCFLETECSKNLGLLSYNKRDYKKRNAPRQETSEWIVAIGKHQGIVTGKDWVWVQTILDANKPKTKSTLPKAHNEYSLLSGMIYCTMCGNKLFANLRKAKETDLMFDYICNSKLRGGRQLCSCKNLNGPQTDRLLFQHLIESIEVQPNILPLLEAYQKELLKEKIQYPQIKTQKKLEKKQLELDSLVTTLSKSPITPALLERVNARATELSTEIEQLKELLKMQQKQEPKQEEDTPLELIAKNLWDLKSLTQTFTLQEKRMFLQQLVQKIHWDGTDLHIFMYGNKKV